MARLVRLGDVTDIRQGLSFSGRGAGRRKGDWLVTVITVGIIEDNLLDMWREPYMPIKLDARTDWHILHPEDVLVSARTTLLKAALVPALLTRAVADSSLLVVRPRLPDLGPYLWWYITSVTGSQQVTSRMTSSTTLLILSAAALADLEVPLPDSSADLLRISELIYASERAYGITLEAAYLRRKLFQDEIVNRLWAEARAERGNT